MVLEKLEKLEEVLIAFRQRYDLVEKERRALKSEVEGLKARIEELEAEREKIRSKIDSLLGTF